MLAAGDDLLSAFSPHRMPVTTDLLNEFRLSKPAVLLAIAQVRNAVGKAHLVFEDAQVENFLALTEGGFTPDPLLAELPPDWRPAPGEEFGAHHILLAAALAVDTIASNEAYVQKVIETLGLKTDGAKLADALRAQAKALRNQVLSPALPSLRPAPRGRSVRSRRVDANSRSCSSRSRCSEHSC